MKTQCRPILLVTLIIVIVLVMVFLHNTFKGEGIRDFEEIKKGDELNVVTEYNSVDYYVSGDSIAGLQYELCKYIGERSGLIVRIFLENNLEVSISDLKANVYDIIARNIPITNENKQSLAFTVPITQSKQVLVQRKPSENDSTALFIRNQIDLAKQTIYITPNSPAILRLNNLSEEIAEPIYIKEITDYTSEQLIYMVAKKEINYTVVDKEIAAKNKILFPDLDFGMDISFTQLQAWALRKTSTVLLDSLNIWISDFKKLKE